MLSNNSTSFHSFAFTDTKLFKMTTTTSLYTTWHADEKLIVTAISGEVDIDDILCWNRSLLQGLEQVPDNSTFKILVNLYGFKAVNFEAHKRFRTVVPTTLAGYGWRVGYLDLFEEAAHMSIFQTRGIRCTAAVHVHQDETKIELYDSRFGYERERFFTDTRKAAEWIHSVEA